MILPALVDQFGQRFQHEKRARVCLWFDEKGEFQRLLPALRAHLEAMPAPPFELLEYDVERRRGQIWIKHRIHGTSEERWAGEGGRQRFVVWLPFAEDRLEHGGADGEPALDLLAEYGVAGVTWRVDGRRPTLFRFLKQAGVVLPGTPSEQRRLYEGGCESLLAKYAARFADQPATFWSGPLSAEWAQSRLIGDVDQTILDLAVSPETAWRDLNERGLVAEFLALVRERYGFDGPLDRPAAWVAAFVAALALTETFLGYGEPADFPLAERLPPVSVRIQHRQLLQRWLRDSESRSAWDRWIREVEGTVDLSAWARGKPGFCFGFPHLVRMRWRQVAEAFAAAARKSSTTTGFFREHGELIAREAEYSRASPNPVGAWVLLHRLQELAAACEHATERAEAADTVGAVARVFVDQAPTVDATHLEVRRHAEQQNQPAVAAVADRVYATYANTLNTRFFERYIDNGEADIPEFRFVTEHLEAQLWTAKSKRAVLVVDALRYDCAHLVRQALPPNLDVQIDPVRAALPTVTPVGMTALLPLSTTKVSFEVKGNDLHPRLDGKDAALRSNRIAFLEAFGADCRPIDDLEACADPPDALGNLLVVFGHDEVDQLGHASADVLVRHVHLEIERIARLVRKLHGWGYQEVHVVTDHGFILLDRERLPDEVPCNRDWCRVRKARFALVPAEADLPIKSLPFDWDPTLRVALPPGLAFFQAEQAFSHGGAALQELVIPHLVSRSQVAVEARIGVEVVLPTFELLRAAVKVKLRPALPESPSGGQMALFPATGRTVSLDVLRTDEQGTRASVLVGSRPKEVRVDADAGERNATLFFDSAQSFSSGELLDLDIRDVETTEQFPPGGVKLTVGRDL
ncbi:MAG: PglZ domain-containing protein [Gammaproteobacteria bacterium]|nr:PglZ domain-containing protein [Gammaproteobacteria bacterium]